MSQSKQESSALQKYRTVINETLSVLNREQTMSQESSPLTPYLTPAGNIALSILKNEPTSYTNQIIEILTEGGIPSNYHALFIAPINQVYLLGLKDLKVGIQKLWTTTIEPQIMTLFSCRPFNSQGEGRATYQDVENLTNPNSEFFQIVKGIIAPVSLTQSGCWVPRPGTDIELAPEIYATFNRLAKVSQNLWDTQGNPKPIYYTIQSLPFETQQKFYPAPIISYLVTGDETFHNFNQNPSWHTIKVEWWKESNSTVVMELANKNDTRSYRDEKITNTLWSFYELLLKASTPGKNVWQWELESQFSDGISHVALEFQTSPWEIFN
jgi:hypothetical protein